MDKEIVKNVEMAVGEITFRTFWAGKTSTRVLLQSINMNNLHQKPDDLSALKEKRLMELDWTA